MTLQEHLIDIWSAITELRRKTTNQLRHGPITDVDPEKQLCRVRLNPEAPGEQPFKSAWIPYGQFAGAFKFHNPVSVGQNVTVMAPGGDLGQAVALPFTWSDQYPSPGTKDDEHIVTLGQLTITIKGDKLEAKLGESKITMTPNDVEMKRGDAVVKVNAQHAHMKFKSNVVWVDNAGSHAEPEIDVLGDTE